MTVLSALRSLRERWPMLVAGALVGLLVGLGMSLVESTRYTANASVYVAGIDNAPSAGSDVYASTLLVTQRSVSYRELATSARVLEPVGRELGAPVTAADVAASSQTSSAIFTLSATEDDPGRATTVANAVAARFAQVVDEIERPGGPNAPATVTASVLDRAVGVTAVGPTTGLNALVGVVFGLLAAAAWILTRAVLDHSIRTAAALAAASGGVTLAVLPPPAGRRGSRGTGPAHDEPVRRLRDLLAVKYGEARVIGVAGATAGSGTTALVRSLAGALAGQRLLVVDAHVRLPALGPAFGLPADAPGLADVLAGATSVAQAVREVDGVDVLAAGTAPPDPGSLFAGSRLAEVMDEVRDRYDHVIVDGPALDVALDGAVVGRHCDGLVLVVREGRTSVEDVESAVAVLETTDVRLLGSVLTGSRSRKAGRNVPGPTPAPAAGAPDGAPRTSDAESAGRSSRRDHGRSRGGEVVSSGRPRSLDM